MSERKIQTMSLPLRLRIRPQNDLAQSDTTTIQQVHAAREEKRSRQIKELIRLCDLLRADLSLHEVLPQIATSMTACTGFRALVINLLNEQDQQLRGTVSVGFSKEDEQTLLNTPFSIEAMHNLLRSEFRISQSYFIPHQHINNITNVPVVYAENYRYNANAADSWHPEDIFLVPLYSPRENKILGLLSLDNPEDGKIPTVETIEIVELFANKVAIAIDNARLYEEREAERIALEQGIADLCKDLERLKAGDFCVVVQPSHPKLEPAAMAINAMTDQLNAVFNEMNQVTQVADEHTHHVQEYSDLLATDTTQQKALVHKVSEIIGDFASMINTISEHAAKLSKSAVDAMDVTNEGQSTIDRAVEGMSVVRDATLHSARTMKSLSESGQEINEAVSVMSDLTMRLHLLALNSAIEATRTGEHGKGFVIIAQEIRSLATQSSDAARKVSTYIRTIQQETTAASHSIEQSTQQVIVQSELVTQSGVALDAIRVVTKQLSTLIQDVVKSAQTQDLASQDVVKSIDAIHNLSGDVTINMQEVQQSTQRLVEISNSLRSHLSQLHLR